MLLTDNKSVEKRPRGGREKWEVADIFREYGNVYRLNHLLPPAHLKVMHEIEVCRTAYLGGHIEKCDSCGAERNAYNSCRNRHCPKCQAMTKARWLQARKAELLPVTYFHNVFTLPHQLNPIARCNKNMIFDILFKAVSETLLQFGRNSENGLGGKLGLIALLHTWDQKLNTHIHLHCVIPGGALSFDGSTWIASREEFLFPVKALSKLFQGKFIHYLQEAFAKGKLIFPGSTEPLGTSNGFSYLKNQLWKKDWVVFSKPSFSKCRKLFGLSPELPMPGKKSNQELMLELTGIDVTKCPDCKKGTMKVIAEIPMFSGVSLYNLPNEPKIIDSS